MPQISPQVQRMKLDTEAAMLKLDQLLRASELSLSVVAALPGLALTWGLATFLIRSAGSGLWFHWSGDVHEESYIPTL